MDGKLVKKTKKVLMKWGVTEKEAEDFIKDLEATFVNDGCFPKII